MEKKLDPAHLSILEAAKVLRAAGAHYATEENLRSDISAGAPVNADGTINLVHLAAWLAKEEASRGN